MSIDPKGILGEDQACEMSQSPPKKQAEEATHENLDEINKEKTKSNRFTGSWSSELRNALSSLTLVCLSRLESQFQSFIHLVFSLDPNEFESLSSIVPDPSKSEPSPTMDSNDKGSPEGELSGNPLSIHVKSSFY